MLFGFSMRKKRKKSKKFQFFLKKVLQNEKKYGIIIKRAEATTTAR